MRYRSFRIQNFKGIKDTTIDLGDGQGVSVYALVGLNESGKTTILEAIHSFSPDSATSQLVGGDATSGVPFKRRVPRHLLSNFTGNVVVTVAVSVTEEDRTEVAKSLAADHKITLNTKRIPDMMAFERRQEFQNGNLFKSYFYVDCPLEKKTGSQRKWREPTMDEYIILRDALYQRTPDIAYFPTFVFEFPKRIFLTDSRGTVIDQFYRQVFQDILDFDGQGHSIDGTIISRIRSSTLVTQWVKFLTLFNSGDDKEKIQHVMDRAGSVVTRVVFGRWNQIFGEDARGKEVFISYDVLEGEVVQTNGSTART